MIIERNHDVKIDEKTFGDAATVGRFVNRNDSGFLVPTNADIPELDVLFVGEQAVHRLAENHVASRTRLAPRRDEHQVIG